MPHRAELLLSRLRSVNRRMFAYMRDDLKISELPPVGLGLLKTISESPGITVSELSRSTGITKSHVSGTIEGLRSRGLVERRSDPSDHRLARFYPTEQAEHFFAEVAERIRDHLGDVLREVASEKIDALLDGLQELESALRRVPRTEEESDT